MRVSRDIAERNRQTVVDRASHLFREHGYDGIGVAGLMQAAGLTHGGFYKQFRDKAALATEATAAALDENFGKWEAVIAASDATPAEAIARWYLSPQHLATRSEGCCFAALAAEAPRQDEAIRKEFARAIAASASLLEGEGATRKDALRHMATMVGALILARAVGEDPLAEDLLAAAAPDGP